MAVFSTTAVAPKTTTTPPPLPKPYRPSSAAYLQSPLLRFNKFSKTTTPSVFCILTKQPMASTEEAVILQRPDSFGRFGKFGGKYVPETLMHALSELEDAFRSLSTDQEFQVLTNLSIIFFCFSSEYCLIFRKCDFFFWFLSDSGC